MKPRVPRSTEVLRETSKRIDAEMRREWWARVIVGAVILVLVVVIGWVWLAATEPDLPPGYVDTSPDAPPGLDVGPGTPYSP